MRTIRFGSRSGSTRTYERVTGSARTPGQSDRAERQDGSAECPHLANRWGKLVRVLMTARVQLTPNELKLRSSLVAVERLEYRQP